MKIEMNEPAALTTCFVALLLTIVACFWLIFDRDKEAMRLGYTKATLQGQSEAVWVKP